VTVRTRCEGLARLLRLKDMPERAMRILVRLAPDIPFQIEVERNVEARLCQIMDTPQGVFFTDGACMGNGTEGCKAAWAVIADKNPELNQAGFMPHSHRTRKRRSRPSYRHVESRKKQG